MRAANIPSSPIPLASDLRKLMTCRFPQPVKGLEKGPVRLGSR